MQAPPINTTSPALPQPISRALQDLYPFTSRLLDLGGFRLHYLDEGRGDPVVMLHGNPTWSFFFRSLILALRGTYRTIVPDHIGCGLSEKPDDSRYEYHLARRVQDLESLLEHLNLGDNLTLVLHDWGGMIGMAYAHRHPQRVKRLIILNTGAFLLPPGKRLPWSLWLGRKSRLGHLLIRSANAFCRGALRYCAVKPLPDEVRQAYLAPYDSWANRIAVLRFVQDIPLGPTDRSFALVDEVQKDLARFRDLPALICWGERDFVFDHHFLAQWQDYLPDAEVHRFPDAGHYVLEDAGDAIARLAQDFLSRHPLGSRACLPTEKRLNMAAPVFAMARSHPDMPAIIRPRGKAFRLRSFTYRDLADDTKALAAGLHALGIRRGMRTVLMVPPSLQFFTLTFALFHLGAVVVLIDPGMGIKNLGVCLEEARPQAFIGIPKAHIARILFGWAKQTLLLHVTVGPRLGWGGVTLNHVGRLGKKNSQAVVAAPTNSGDLAAILFTSGSTGVAKGVIYTHGIFAAQVEMLRNLYGIQPGEIDLPTFPLFGLFGPALGMTAIIPQMNPTRPARVNPQWIIRAIQHFRVTNLFGSPALINRVGRYGSARGVRLPTLRRVISAGAPVPARVIERFATMLVRDVQVHTPYGATEALPVASIASAEILGETGRQACEGRGVCVGMPVAGMTVRVIRISDDPIAVWSDSLLVPAGEIGEIVVAGPVVTRAYYNRPESTQLAKIHDGTIGSIWHRMGDLGYFDDRGRLWFCGRKSQRVKTGQGTLFTIPCEGVFNAHPAVLRTALVGVQGLGSLEPVLIVQLDPEAGRQADETLKHELLDLGARHEQTRNIRTILFHPDFPVDIRHNAKIFREKLAQWAVRQLR